MEGVHHLVLGWGEWSGVHHLSHRMGRVDRVHHSVLGWDECGGTLFGSRMGQVEGVHHLVLGMG